MHNSNHQKAVCDGTAQYCSTTSKWGLHQHHQPSVMVSVEPHRSAGKLTGVRSSSQKPSKQHPSAGTLFGYSPPPEEPNLLSRDVWRWVQRLDLSTPIRNPRRDLSNGFLAAEMLGRFYPADVQMHSYQNGTSEPLKRDNWDQVCKVAQKHELQLPRHLVDGTIKGSPGAAVSLLESLYEQLTGKKVQRLDANQLSEGPGTFVSAGAAAGGFVFHDTADADSPALSFGEPAAASDSGALRTIRATGTAPVLEFGAVQTQIAGNAAEIRQRFAS